MIPALPLPLRDRFDRLPTTDLYFLTPLLALRRAEPGRLPPVRRLAANIYAVGRTAIIVRYATEADLDRLRHKGIDRLVYIADDDYAAGGVDAMLPARYRRKLADFADGAWPALRDAADIVIVPGAVLAEIYGEKARIVPPVWHRPPAATQHFDGSATIEMVHLGSGSHAGDLADLAPALASTLDAHPRARLTLFSGDAPGGLAGHGQVRARRPLSWWRYKRALPRMRFHLALYPLADTAFNRARSANKLYEHALVGAAALMSPIPALREAAGPEPAGLFVEGGIREWPARLAADLADPEALRERAEATRARILADDPLGRSLCVWREILADAFS